MIPFLVIIKRLLLQQSSFISRSYPVDFIAGTQKCPSKTILSQKFLGGALFIMSHLFVHFVLSLYECSLADLCFFQEHKWLWCNLLFHCVSVSLYHLISYFRPPFFNLNSSHFLFGFIFLNNIHNLLCIRNASLVSFIARLLFLISTMLKKNNKPTPKSLCPTIH